MNNVIILEGPDNIGKSTLVNDIKLYDFNEKPEFVIKHWGPNKTKAEGRKVMDAFIRELRNKDNTTYVCDRSPFGEFVYGQMFRTYDPWSYFESVVSDINRLNTRFLFISFWADENTYDIFKLPKKDDEEKEYQHRHMSEKVSNAFIGLTHRLRDITSMTRLIVNCNNYDSLDERNEYVLDNVRAFLFRKDYVMDNPDGFSATCFNPDKHFWTGSRLIGTKYLCVSFRKKCELGKQHVNDSGYKGIWEYPCSSSGDQSVFSKYVFVGEAPGNYHEDKHSLPFYGDRSGDIFHNALRVLNLLPTEVYVTNVIHCSPKKHDLGIFADTHERLKLECVQRLLELGGFACPIIALGRIADITLKALNIPHKFMYHPSYFARINKPKTFLAELQKVL